jgi:hypothetical protein
MTDIIHEDRDPKNSKSKPTSEPMRQQTVIQLNGTHTAPTHNLDQESFDKLSSSNNNSSSDSSTTNSTGNNNNNNANSNGNVHVNELYYHAQQFQQENCKEPKQIPLQTQVPQSPSPPKKQLQLNQSDINRSNYVPHQKTDRVVVKIKNKSITSNSKLSTKSSSQHQTSQSSQAKQVNQNGDEKSGERKGDESKLESGISSAVLAPSAPTELSQQMSNVNLNNSLLSDNGELDLLIFSQ